MKSKKISNREGAFLIALAVMTNAYSYLPAGGVGRGIWLSDIIAGVLAIILSLFFTAACDAFPDESAYGVLRRATGRYLAPVLGGALCVFALLTTVVSLTVFSRFVQITALPRTPQIIIPTAVVAISALALSRELSASGGAASLLFWFSLGVFILFLLSGAGELEPSLLLPEAGKFSDVLKGAGEVFLNRFWLVPALMAIYTRMSDRKGRRKYFLGSLSGAVFALALISATTVAILGEKLTETDFYPVYTVMSIHSLGGFVRHTEIFACIAMTISLFFKCAVCLIFSEDMINGITKTRRSVGIALPLALICAASTQLIYKDISSLRGLFEWKSGGVVLLLINIAIPTAVMTGSFLKNKKTN